MSCSRKPFIAFIAALVVAALAHAQSVTWSPSSGTLQEGKTYEIYISFVGCEPKGELPADLTNDDLSLTLSGSRRQQTSIVNGRASSRVEISYSISAKRRGAVSIPSFTIETSEGPVVVPAATFEATETTVGNTGLKPEEVLLSRFAITDPKIYVGEIFDLDYYAGADTRLRIQGLSTPAWQPSNLVATELKAVRDDRATFDGKNYQFVLYRLQAIATRPGRAELPGMQQVIQIAVGTRNTGLFQETVTDTLNLTTEPFALEILPLPEGAPASFAGAVGSFELVSRVVPETVQVGEPVTWTLELSGTGNWPSGIGVPPRSVSSAFKPIQPVKKTEFAEGELFTGKQTEDIVLIPTRPGAYSFGPVAFSYFDPKTETYQSITLPAAAVTVEAAPGQPTAIGETSPQLDSEGDEYLPDLDLSPRGENTGKRLPSLPREPVASLTPSPIPTGSISLLRPTALALAAPLALWLLLALGKAIALDPNQARRRAFTRLQAKTSEVSRAASFAEAQQKLYAWRAAAQQYWGLDTAEATPKEIAHAVSIFPRPDLVDQWRQLWAESDRILYSGQQTSIETWTQLARAALLAAPRPRRGLAPFWTKSIWFGLTSLAISLLLAHPTPALANADADALYAAGSFADAEKTWIAAAQQNPDAWEPRYNAGLAAAQRKDWASAWAHWASAYCLNPGDERIAWNLRVAQTHTRSFDPLLQTLLEGKGAYRIIALRSPARWESLALQLVWAAGACFCLAVASRYLPPLRRATSSLLVLGFLLGLGAYFSKWSHSKYSYLAQPETVLVTRPTTLRTIPSDLAEEQQLQAPIGEGSIATVEKNFLGWSKLSLPNGDSGWLRKSTYQPLYGPPN